jgi:hypothetical protein
MRAAASSDQGHGASDETVNTHARFDQIVTQRGGALNEHFSAPGPLGDTRMLWTT